MRTLRQHLTTYPLEYLVFISSIILSLIVFSHHQSVNRDGVLYIETARAFLTGGIPGAFSVYHWPFYSILIAISSPILHLSLLNTAYLLNTLFIAGISVLFVSIVKTLTPHRALHWLALVLVLIYPHFNHLRSDVLRDFGYLFFYLAALLTLLRYSTSPKRYQVLLWPLFLGCAILFRSEGIIFFAAPLFLLGLPNTSWKMRLKAALRINYLVYPMLLLGIGLIFYYHEFFISYGQQFVENFSGYLQKRIYMLSTEILSEYTAHYATPALVAILVMLFAAALIKTANPLFLGLAIYGICRPTIRRLLTNAHSLILIGFLLLNFLMLGIFLTKNFFLSSRYVLPSGFIILCFVPFTIPPLLKIRFLRYVIGAWMLIMFIGIVFHMGSRSDHIIKAGTWLKNHTAQQAFLLTNDKRIPFYAERRYEEPPFFFTVITEEGKHIWKKYDYLIVRTKQKEALEQIQTSLGAQPIQVFKNNRHAYIYIFENPGKSNH